MTSRRSGATWVAVWAAMGGGAAALGAQDYATVDREWEMRLAISAGPLAVSQQADVWVMGPEGFERAIEGSNGWACIVVRSAGAPKSLAPHCLNPYAVGSVLPAFLLEGRLQAQGMGAEAILQEMNRQWETGQLPIPSGPAYAYMLSAGQRLGPNEVQFKPHFMLYVPYATNESIGGDPGRHEFPFVGPVEGAPLSTVVIVMDEFVDPADVVLPGS